MKVVIQRSKRASVTVDGQIIGQINKGLVLLVGVTHDDTEKDIAFLADKIANLRIFEDESGKMNLSLLDAGGDILSVSQFTLYADTRKGRRPSFIDAALPDVAEPLVTRFVELLRDQGVPTQAGQFGAHMLVEINNDGPVTISLEK